MLPSVFVSYSHRDADSARQLVADITLRVRSVWFDEIHIRPGRYWDDEIEKAIRDCDVFLSLLSPNMLASKICKDEFDNADRLGKSIIPILITQCDNENMWMRLARRQWIDFRTDYEAGLNKLLKELSQLGAYTIPLTKKCRVCDYESETAGQLCPQCKSPYCPSRLGEIYDFPAQHLQKYLEFYQPRTRSSNARVDDLITVSLIHLAMRSYDVAKSFLEQLTMQAPNNAYVWYLLALIMLRGKRPRLLTHSEAVEIQAMLLKAISYDMLQACSFLLLGLDPFWWRVNKRHIQDR